MTPTTVKAAPKPLRLQHIRRDVTAKPSPPVAIEDLPPTFPAQPYDIGLELVDESTYHGENDCGYRRYAPVQPGAWRLQPKYRLSTPILCDMQELNAFTRTHVMGSPDWTRAYLNDINQYPIPNGVRWLHSVRVHPQIADQLVGAAIIVDFVDEDLVYSERRKILEDTFPILGIREKPEVGRTYLAPEFTDSISVDLWLALHLQNEEWHDDFYNGIIGKRVDAKYPVQTEDHRKHTLSWLSYKFQ